MSIEFVIAILGLAGVLATALIADMRSAKQSQLTTISCIIDNLQEDVKRLRGENDDLRKRIVTLEEENSLSKIRIGELEAENRLLHAQNTALRDNYKQAVKR